MEGCVKSEKYTTIKTPGGYKFHIIDEEKSGLWMKTALSATIEAYSTCIPITNTNLYYDNEMNSEDLLVFLW